MRIDVRILSLYLFSLVIIYLAGIYFGSVLHLLFVFFLVYPLLSVVSALVWYAGVRCSQSFSTRNPVKGETVVYRLTISNRGVLPITNLTVAFNAVSESLGAELADFTTNLPAQGYMEQVYRIQCPYRGSYEVGVREIVVHDQLRLLTLRKRVAPVAFTVYPRVLSLQQFAPVATDIEGSGRYASVGLLPDPTLFQELREYRDGDNIRHIYWKKFASTGRPFLKEYERTKRSGVRIYVDLRRTQIWGVNNLEQEDVTIETLVALVRYLVDRRIHTTVVAAGTTPYVWSGQDESVFDDFYRSTANLHFVPTGSPMNLFQSDKNAGRLESQTVILVTHLLDPELFSTGKHDRVDRLIVIFNKSCAPEGAARDIEDFLRSARRRGTEVMAVNGSDTILKDLGENAYAYGR